MKTLKSILNLPENIKVMLYGTGTGGCEFFELLQKERPDIKILGFIDSFKTGRYKNVDIFKIDSIENLVNKIDLILIVSMFKEAIIKELDKIKYHNYLYVNTDWYRYTNIFTREERNKHLKEIKKVEGILKFDEDKVIFREIMNRRTIHENNGHDFSSICKEEAKQYLDFVNFERVNTIIEGGVFDGREIMKFQEKCNGDCYIYGFEPFFKGYVEGKHYNILKENPRVKVYPLGLWHKESKEAFNINWWSSSILKENEKDGSQEIQQISTITVDKFVQKEKIKKIDFIKLDVEGSELEVLKGAENILKRDRPQMAISLYHKKEHMLELPMLVAELTENYIFRIAHYSNNYFETVLYAIPEEIYEERNENEKI